jgi:mRNA interferase RelE/StbE
MTTYKIRFSKSAQKDINKLPKNISVRLMSGINKLANSPKAGDVRPMVGSSSWRLRVGDYRVVYDILGDKLIILILKAKHRKDVYK